MKFCWLTTFPSVEMELKTYEHGMRICADEAEDIPGPERDPGFKSVMTSPHVTSFDHVVSGFLLSFSVNFWLFFVASLLSRGVLESVRWRVGCWVSNPWSR